MKATGIVRRIDGLGRVVVPKEIRKAMKLNEGEQIEMFTNNECGIILKKYSPIYQISEFINMYTESIQQTIGNIIIISDTDTIIAASGIDSKVYIGKKITHELETVMKHRKLVTSGEEVLKRIPIYEDEKFINGAQVISPIISEGDVIGAVIILSNDEGLKFGELELKLAETASLFLSKQIEP